MNAKSKIRPVVSDDIPALKAIVEANELFPSDMLDEMISGYFNDENSSDYWLTYEDRHPIAIAYYAPERMTEGTWNLYLIAVHPDRQGEGRGTAMVKYIERVLADRSQRILLVETSGMASFESTRSFYRKCGYEEEARIREFYQTGEDKIIFRKSLK